ncbi:PAS domain S-box protein [candidate division KSB1 bacterium]|nr:PAS domain S-box protein [candidate division KSB1 bacterium]
MTQKTSLLYIEDDNTQRQTLYHQLLTRGFRVTAVDTGSAGLIALAKKSYDVIICDLNLPDINGLDVLKSVKTCCQNIPLIFITAHGTIQTAVEAIKNGAFQFILKPVEIDQLVKTIQQALIQAKYQKDLEVQVRQRTQHLQTANRQLFALNKAAGDFSQATDSDALLDVLPRVLSASLGYSRSVLVIYNGDQLCMRSNNLTDHEQNVWKRFLYKLNSKELKPPAVIRQLLEKKKTVYLNQSQDQPFFRSNREKYFVSAFIATPLNRKNKVVGYLAADTQDMKRQLDEQDIVRFEMFVHMAELALDNITTRQNLEKTVDERTASLQQALSEVQHKANELEKATLELANANIQMLAVQEELESKDKKLQTIVNISPIPLMISQISDGEILYINESMCKLTGLPADQIIGRKTLDFYSDPKDRDEVLRQISENGSLYDYELEIKIADSRRIHVILSLTQTELDGDSVLIGALYDITERKEAEKKLLDEIAERITAQQETATRLRYEEGLAACSRALLTGGSIQTALTLAMQALQQAVGVGRVYIYENFTRKNKRYMQILAQVSAKNCPDKMSNGHPGLIGYHQGFQRWEKKLAGHQPIYGTVSKFPQKEKEKLERQGILSILVLSLWSENEWYGFIGFDDLENEREWDDKDIRLLQTAADLIGGYIFTKNTEQALCVSEARFRSLVENANDIIFSTNAKGEFTYLSPQFRENTGYSVDEFIGHSPERLIHPEDIENFRQTWLNSSSVDFYEKEYRLKHRAGDWKWFVIRTTPIMDKDNQMVEHIGIAHDVSALKKALRQLEKSNNELIETQSQLIQSEKMAALGNLVAGIAHEINTPVGAVNSMHNTLVRALDKLKAEIKQHYVQQNVQRIDDLFNIIEQANKVIKSGSERVANIVKRLRSFARLDEAELKDADIHEGIEDTLILLQHEMKHNIKVIKKYGNIPKIDCYPGRLNQVFLNLLINARQAIKSDGKIFIRTYFKNEKVHIEFKDNGCGIPPQDLPKIFDPGFTTKGVGIGTGLGLSICYQIINDHMGEILVKSQPGEGSTFTVVLPTDLDRQLNFLKNQQAEFDESKQ